MLMVTRRIGERIVIGEGIEVVITEIHRRTVRLAIKAPPGHLIFRGEVWDAIAKANRQAAESGIDEDALSALDPAEPEASPEAGPPAAAPSAPEPVPPPNPATAVPATAPNRRIVRPSGAKQEPPPNANAKSSVER